MTRVILQPAANSEAQKHYNDTILNPVVLSQHADLLAPADSAALQEIYPSGAAPLWGATPGVSDSNRIYYDRMSIGDLVLFSGQKRVFSGATITHLMENAPLAERLWGRDSRTDLTWQLMFALDELRAFDIPYREINAVIPWKLTTNFQRFQVLTEQQSAGVIDLLGLDSPTFDPGLEANDVSAELAALGGETEREVTRQQRREQRILRKSLLPGPFGDCALCGETYPAAFLVAAHIKKRSQCSNDERLTAAVVMLACTFGCDSLFENGYLTVADSGAIEASSLLPATPAVGAALAKVAGRMCPAFDEQRAGYFAWHREHTFKRGLD